MCHICPTDRATRPNLQALAELTPNFFGFVISFFVIGAFWAGHHRAFGLAAHHTDKLVGANLLMLCAIVFMPFATAFMSANIGETVPAALYASTLLVTGLLNRRLVFMATGAPVVSEHASRDAMAYSRSRSGAVILGSTCALAVAFIDPRFSQAALMTVPIWMHLLVRRTTQKIAKAAA